MFLTYQKRSGWKYLRKKKWRQRQRTGKCLVLRWQFPFKWPLYPRSRYLPLLNLLSSLKKSAPLLWELPLRQCWRLGPELQPMLRRTRPCSPRQHQRPMGNCGVWSTGAVFLQTQVFEFDCNFMLDEPGYLRKKGKWLPSSCFQPAPFQSHTWRTTCCAPSVFTGTKAWIRASKYKGGSQVWASRCHHPLLWYGLRNCS